MSGWSALYKQGNKVFITSKLPNHSVVCRFIKYRSLIWPWLVAISLCFLHNFSRLSRLSYKHSYQRSWRIWNYCSHEAYSMLCKSIFQFPENWQISALSYPAITTLMNLIAYTKKYNKWSQKHSIQLWLGENNIFYLKLAANSEQAFRLLLHLSLIQFSCTCTSNSKCARKDFKMLSASFPFCHQENNIIQWKMESKKM